jgi:hypothetical protein
MVKAYLILLVIIDHNNFSRDFIGPFLDGFTFHVVGFFSLYYMNKYDQKQNYTGLILKQVVRYLYPYILFVITLSIAIYVKESPDLVLHVSVTLKALYSGNYLFLKQSTHMYLLWFLPVFVSFVFLDRLYKGYSEGYPKLLFFLLFILFVCVPFIPNNMRITMPMGILTAFYILFLAVIIKFLYINYISNLKIKIRVLGLLFVFILIKLLQIKLNFSQEIGFLQVSTITEPLGFVINSLESIIGVLLVYAISSIPLKGFLNDVGKYSLQIYLFHAFFAAFIYKILIFTFNEHNVLIWLASIILTAGVSTVVAVKTMKNRMLLRYLFPKDFNTLIVGNK